MERPNRRLFLRTLGGVGIVGVNDPVAQVSAARNSFSQTTATDSEVTIVISDEIHHLGDGSYTGKINSRFREPAEEPEFRTYFELTENQTNANSAKLTFDVRGAQGGDSPMYINNSLIGYIAESRADGKSEEQVKYFHPDVFERGENEFEVEAAYDDTIDDYDDFEIEDIVLHLSGINRLPVPSVSVKPSLPTIGTEATLDASESTDPDGSIQRIEWDFDNDGTIDARGESVTTTFQQAPEAQVTLYITDDEGATKQHTVSFPVEFIFRRREEKLNLAETLHEHSVLSELESMVGEDISGDPKMARNTLAALKRAVNNGNVDQPVAENTLDRLLLAENATDEILSHVGPAEPVETNLARTTAKYALQTAVDAFLIIAAIKAGVAGVATVAVTMLEDAIGYLLDQAIPVGDDFNLRDEMYQATRQKARTVVDRIVDGTLSGADEIATAVEDIIEDLVETLSLAYRSWIELESFNAIMEVTRPNMNALSRSSVYGSLRDLDSQFQPGEVRDGLAGDTEIARNTVTQTTMTLVEYIKNVSENIEQAGRIGDEFNIYDMLNDVLTGESDLTEETLQLLAKAITQGLVGFMFDTAATISGALSAIIIKVTHQQLLRSISTGREVTFTHV